jgi:hypothetical protein
MNTEIWLNHVDQLTVDITHFDDDDTPWSTMVLGDDDGGYVKFYANDAQLLDIANTIYNVLRPAPKMDIATEEVDTTLVCDHCRRPVESDGDIDGVSDRRWFLHVDNHRYQCEMIGGSNSPSTEAEVRGQRQVRRYELLAAEDATDAATKTVEVVECGACYAPAVFAIGFKNDDGTWRDFLRCESEGADLIARQTGDAVRNEQFRWSRLDK